MTGTHDNRAVWDGQYAVNECFAESVRDNGWMTIGRRVECEDYAWAQRVNAPDARGLCSALADALGVELHPAGTFDPCSQSYPLTARGREVLAAIDACRVTEAEPDPDIPYLPTWAISSLLHLLWIDDENLPDAYLHRQVAAELKSKGLIRLTRYEHYALTPTGRALAKRFLANMRRKPPEPEPIGYSLRALLGLAWEYVHDARAGSSFLDAARAEGLLVGTYGERKPTDLGRKTWTDFLRRLGLPGDGSKPEPEPEPTLTESADGRREWWLNGVRHREDGPAIEWPDGRRDWWLHGKRHREDGPAIELPDGRREWWLHGKRHREDSPAIEWPDGYRSWWLNGVRQPEPDKGGRQ